MLAFFLTMLESDEERQRFVLIYEQYHKRMERVALRILEKQHDAEDAVQNAFLQVIHHFEKISTIPCEELPFWLISIVKNEALMILRKSRNIVPLEDWDGFEKSISDTSEYMALVELFRQLPETYRAVLEMKILIGYTDKEIASRLGISETAVSSRASRGRSLLRKLVEGEGLHT
ncbi:sigma-70 family RNA polymerase sigma factor [uncultured Bacteroides sp.]|uniref:RNA polymerase sigma factor n=1 Tax=uncultured Bacteroides sp. TaxID=162156 RepID=UPI0025B0E402|nr:sigma-70 family RNA polymerase sigma factor [uncultured Bacteroides sp.]